MGPGDPGTRATRVIGRRRATRVIGRPSTVITVTMVMLWRLCLLVLLISGCSTGGDGPDQTVITPISDQAASDEATSAQASTLALSTSSNTASTLASTTAPQAGSPLPTTPRPAWLGQRTIPTSDEGQGLPLDTPPELLDRRFATVDTLPPPIHADVFDPTSITLDQAPEVLARSTWAEGCPVEPEDLVYITVPFWGFDGLVHTGELIVHQSAGDSIIGVFEQLYGARFPIEEMRVVTKADLVAPPIGDTNNSTGFVCRPVSGGNSFSEHAKGLAVDINPFHNPYIRGERVLPEQATVYTDRSLDQRGMIGPDSIAVEAFEGIGWTWGGDWSSLKDYQHFSANGR